MGFLVAESAWADAALLVLTAGSLLYWYLTYNYDHWTKKGVPEIKQKELFFGSVRKSMLMQRQIGLEFRDFYEELEGQKFGGFFNLRQPALLLRDPELIKHVMVKDFSHFTDNQMNVSGSNDPMFAYNIFAMKGDKWKYARSKLAPAFATGKIKAMFPLILDVCEELKKTLNQRIESKNSVFDAQLVCSNYTTDVVATCAFGIKNDALSDPDNIFRAMGKGLFEPDTFWRQIEIMVTLSLPTVARILRFKFISQKIEDFFKDLILKAFAFREAHPEFKRNDFINLLMQLKKMGGLEVDEKDKNEINTSFDKESLDKGKIEFNDLVLTAQAVGFFIDGFETSSKAFAFTLHELAMNPDVQDKLREELKKSFEDSDGKIDYDNIRSCTYLDMVLNESLRKYPLGGMLTRECTKRYELPGTNVQLEVGDGVAIPVFGLHFDPQYYPNPEVFDPDRFTDEAKKTRPPCTFIAFGEGPRQCIGFRFAQAQIKAALATIILNFEIKQSEKTVHPVAFDDRNFLLSAVGGLPIEVAPL